MSFRRPCRVLTLGSKTAGMLTMGVYFLSQHPEVLHRLRKEILDTVGPTNRPSYDDIRGMKYLRAVINGTLLEAVFGSR